MKQLRLISIPFTFYVLFVSSAYAAPSLYQGVRQMGMGGAGIAVVNDETALLVNPNGLSRLRQAYLPFVDADLTGNTGSIGAVSGLLFKSVEPQTIYDELSDRLDEPYYSRVQSFLSFSARGFGVGVLGKYEARARRLGATQNLQITYVSDLAFLTGFNKSFWGGILKIAGTGKVIDRMFYDGVLNPSTQSLKIKDHATGGLALGADVAVSLTSPTDLLPTLTIMGRNIGDTSFTQGNGIRNLPDQPELEAMPFSLDAAVAIFPIINPYFRTTFTVELEDLTSNGPFTEAANKMHIGSELNFSDTYFIRLGVNRSYPTLGFEWAIGVLQLQMAYYGEEIGTSLQTEKEDRVSLKIQARF